MEEKKITQSSEGITSMTKEAGTRNQDVCFGLLARNIMAGPPRFGLFCFFYITQLKR